MIDKRPIEHFKFTQEEYDLYQSGVEIWRDIPDYENIYKLSSRGRVKSLKRMIYPRTYPQYPCYSKPAQLLKNCVNSAGYYIVSLCKSGRVTSCHNHVLMGICFLNNPESKPCINHRNGIKIDISLSNLEWNTYSENSIHSFTTGLQKPNMLGKTGAKCTFSKRIAQLTMSDKLIKIHVGVRDAGRELNIDSSYISKCARGECSFAKGFKWKYECDLLSLQ